MVIVVRMVSSFIKPVYHGMEEIKKPAGYGWLNGSSNLKIQNYANLGLTIVITCAKIRRAFDLAQIHLEQFKCSTNLWM